MSEISEGSEISAVSAKEKEFPDIDLCYKAMGLSFSDSPERVERTYLRLKDEYGKAIRSPDVAVRTAATEDLKQLEELYTTITGSLIYKDYAKEYERHTALKAEQHAARAAKQATAGTGALVACPHCRKQIASHLAVCIYCHGKLSPSAEGLMSKVLSIFR